MKLDPEYNKSMQEYNSNEAFEEFEKYQIQKSNIYQPSLKEQLGKTKEQLIIEIQEKQAEIKRIYNLNPYSPLIDKIEVRTDKPTFFEIMKLIIVWTPKAIKILYYTIKIINGIFKLKEKK